MAAGSISNQLKGMGIPNKILPVGSRAARIETGRALLKECYIDEVKCKEGIHALMNYQYEWDDARQMFKKEPLHDWASDGADAFGYLAQALAREGMTARPPLPQREYRPQSQSWMN